MSEFITNTGVLDFARMRSIEGRLQKTQLHWDKHMVKTITQRHLIFEKSVCWRSEPPHKKQKKNSGFKAFSAVDIAMHASHIPYNLSES